VTRLASPRTATVLGALAAALLGAEVALTILTRDLRVSNNGSWFATLLGFGIVGVIVARRQPRNAVGWLLIGVAVTVLLQQDLRLYSVLDFRVHHGTLPLGRAVVFALGSWTLLSPLLGLPAILLFPNGVLVPRRWRRVLWVYVALAVFFMVAQIAGEASMDLGRHVQVDVLGEYSGSAGQTGTGNVLSSIGWLAAPSFVVFWGSFVGHQVAEWRRSAGERREQLKWLMFGSAICVAATITVVLTSSLSGLSELVAAVAAVGIAALPVGIGVGILKYRLYEIDRIISRTISYAIVTGLLVSVFVGLVVLTTRVLPFSSPLGVAASTLAAAALFNPLRKRVQRLVDRRFNRARYNAQRTLEAFGIRLRDQVDLETLSGELRDVVGQTMQPASVSLTVRTTGTAP